MTFGCLLPENRVVVFDCADNHVLRSILDSWGRPVVAAFVLSHLDLDHIVGALSFPKTYGGTIEAVYISADRPIDDDTTDAKAAKALVDHVTLQGTPTAGGTRRWEVQPATRTSQPIASGPDWSVRLIAPEHAQTLARERTGTWESPNEHYAVMRVQVGNYAVLIGGDAPLSTWHLLGPNDISATAFRIPHHGGALTAGGVPPGWGRD